MAIVDTDLHMSAPKGLTAASGIDSVTHALEAYASVMATDYTDGLALKACLGALNALNGEKRLLDVCLAVIAHHTLDRKADCFSFSEHIRILL